MFNYEHSTRLAAAYVTQLSQSLTLGVNDSIKRDIESIPSMVATSSSSSSAASSSNVAAAASSESEPLSSLDRKLTESEQTAFIIIFVSVIIFGFVGNTLVIWTILFNKQMRRSPNNLFVLNLAISDLTLCAFSIPFNVYTTLRHPWAFGSFL